MKKLFSILLSVLLFTSLSASTFAVTEGKWIAEQSGFEMPIPDSWRGTKGSIRFSDSGEGMNPGIGIVSATAAYYAMTDEEVEALHAKEMEAYENGDMDTLDEIMRKLGAVQWNLFTVYGINRDRGEKELRAFVIEQNLNPEYYDGNETLMATVKALLDNMAYREIGEKDGLRYYVCSYDADEYLALLELGGVEQGDPAYREEYKALLKQLDSLSVTLTGDAVLANAAETGSKLVFETTDLEGNPVSSEEIFSGYEVTMINLWATWCDPCKNELPALAEMAKDFEQQGCRIIGICLDAEDEETMAEGLAILKEAGADYLNIAPFEGREEILPNKYYPTTYFVDENGVLLDEVISGAQVSRYPLALEKLLGE